MEHEEQKESYVEEQDPFTRLMFGGRRNSQPRDNEDQNEDRPDTKNDNQLNDLLSNVKVEELMKNIDTFMSSTSQFKPLLNKLGPFISKWIK